MLQVKIINISHDKGTNKVFLNGRELLLNEEAVVEDGWIFTVAGKAFSFYYGAYRNDARITGSAYGLPANR